MATLNDDLNRNIVPRWRTFASASKFCEVSSANSAKSLPQHVRPADFADIGSVFFSDPSLSVAADWVSVAFARREFSVADEAARYLIDSREHLPLAKQIAQLYLLKEKDPTIEPDGNIGDHLALSMQLAALRGRLRQFPNNPLGWSDLARLHLLVGQNSKARKAMEAAAHLARDNRFVVRSASRLYLHLGEAERAHSIVAKCARVKSDPWVLASEIAYASVREKHSDFMKRAFWIVENDLFSPYDTSELSAALATCEALAGNIRKAKKLSQKSLTVPSENALAQTSWLDRNFGGMSWRTSQPSSMSNEASAWDNMARNEWNKALECSCEWQREQPFSRRPALFGSYIALSALDEFEIAEKLASSALVCNPNDVLLQNNLVVALAKQSKVDEARRVFSQILTARLSDRENICVTATHGLLKLREGNLPEGRRLYEQAIRKAEAHGFRDLSIMATVYLAAEQARAKAPDFELALLRAKAEIPKLTNGLADRFMKMLSNIELERSESN